MIVVPNRHVAALTIAFAVCGCSSPPPIPTSGLELWLKADAGVTLNGSKVSTWADQSGNGNDAIELDSDRQPLLVRDGLNGKPTIHFDGLDDMLGLTGSKRMTQISFFMVFKMDSDTLADDDPIVFGDIDADGHIWGVQMENELTGYSPDTINIYSGFNGVHAVVPHRVTLGMWHTISVITDGVMWNTQLRANGVDAQVTHMHDFNMLISVPIGNPTGTGIGGIGGTDGARPPIGHTATNCDVAEVILYDAVIPDSLRRLVEQYLAQKYQLPPTGEVTSR
jgi:hypothetical protein